MPSEHVTGAFEHAAKAWLAALVPETPFDVYSLPAVSSALCHLLQVETPVAFTQTPPTVVPLDRDCGPRHFRVSEDLQTQADTLHSLVEMHLANARARGTNRVVNRRVATLARGLSFERVAIFRDRKQAAWVLELLVRIGTQSEPAVVHAATSFAAMQLHFRQAVAVYLEEAARECPGDDMMLVQMEEMRRHLHVEMAQHALAMDTERAQCEASWREMKRAAAYVRVAEDRRRRRVVERELELALWDLQMAESVVLRGVRPDSRGNLAKVETWGGEEEEAAVQCRN